MRGSGHGFPLPSPPVKGSGEDAGAPAAARIRTARYGHCKAFPPFLSAPLSFSLSSASPCGVQGGGRRNRPVEEDGRLALPLKRRWAGRPPKEQSRAQQIRVPKGWEPCARAGEVGRSPGFAARSADLTGLKTLPGCTVPPRANQGMSARRCCPMRQDACGFEPRRDDHFKQDKGHLPGRRPKGMNR